MGIVECEPRQCVVGRPGCGNKINRVATSGHGLFWIHRVAAGGFDHLIESWSLTWGSSYQKRGPAEEWVDSGAEAKEVADVTFEGNLEVFVEKTFASRYVVRLAAQNLLDAQRKDITRVYESLNQYQAGTPVSSELDQEESDPWVILTFRGTF